MIALPLLAPWIVLSALLYPRVNWRGRAYALGARAKLAPVPAAAGSIRSLAPVNSP